MCVRGAAHWVAGGREISTEQREAHDEHMMPILGRHVHYSERSQRLAPAPRGQVGGFLDQHLDGGEGASPTSLAITADTSPPTSRRSSP